MEYQKMINFLDNTSNQPTKFSTKDLVEINDDSNGKYNTNSQIRFQSSTLRSGFWDYSDGNILVSGAVTITQAGVDDAAKRWDKKNKGVILKNRAPFTECISKINNTQMLWYILEVCDSITEMVQTII